MAIPGKISESGSRRRTLTALAILAALVAVTLFFIQGATGQPPTTQLEIGGQLLSVQRLDSIEFVEINTPSRSGQAKQLLLFVHGTPGSLTAFRPYLSDPLLQETFHMIAVTRAGWLNGSDPKQPSLARQAAALSPLLARDQSGRGAILMGHSYGGPVIAKTAMQYPQQVAGLIFVASTGDPGLSGPRWYNRVATAIPAFVLGAALKGANAEILPLRPQLIEMEQEWQNLRLPVLIVQGDRDRLVHPANAEFLRDVLVNADVTYLYRQGQGHFVLWEEQPLIRDNLLSIFDKRIQLACDDVSDATEPQAKC